METSVVSYQQSYEGLPIWEAGLSISANDSPARVTSSTSSLHYDIKIGRPQAPAGTQEGSGKDLSEDELLTVLGISRQPSGPDSAGTERNIRINGRRQLVFQYDPAQRLHPEVSEEARRGPLQEAPPTLPLPPVPEQIRADEHYVVTEYLFTYPMPELGEVHWRAFVEPSTRSVLYLRALVSCATANVYTTDPITRTGNAALTATANPGTIPTTNPGELNYWRTPVTLPQLPPTSPQGLVGSRVSVVDFQTPTAAPPTSPAPGSFDYSVPSDDFAAACAYNNIESLFQLMEGMGFNLATYLDGTTFPVEIDHRSETDVNAHSFGNATGTGMGRYTCGLVQSGSTVSMSCDARVMVHEFVHGLLYDTVHSANLGFVHNGGDSLAVILHAPDSLAPDRFLTFPWVPAVPRRQDRQGLGRQSGRQGLPERGDPVDNDVPHLSVDRRRFVVPGRAPVRRPLPGIPAASGHRLTCDQPHYAHTRCRGLRHCTDERRPWHRHLRGPPGWRIPQSRSVEFREARLLPAALGTYPGDGSRRAPGSRRLH
jgi:hypothetical protein